MTNFKVCSQKNGGRTFEDELFIENIENDKVAVPLFKQAVPNSLENFIDKYGFDIDDWKLHINEIDRRSIGVINKYIKAFDEREDKEAENRDFYEKLMFAELFLHYVENNKGAIALSLLTDDDFHDEDENTKLKVPEYIVEGLKWLNQ